VLGNGLFDTCMCLEAWTLLGKGPRWTLEALDLKGYTIWCCLVFYVATLLLFYLYPNVSLIDEEFMWCLRCMKS